MARNARDVTDAELAVLQVLWDHGWSPIRLMAETLYPGGTSSHYATVQKLLERLEHKECVVRDRSRWPHVFRAVVGRDDLISRRLTALAEKLCEGALTPLLTNLVRETHLTAEERGMLRQLLDDIDRAPPPPRS